MQIDHEIEVPPPHIFHDARDLPERRGHEAIAQRHAINDQHIIGAACKLYNLLARLPDSDRDARARKTSPDRMERGQAQHYVAELPEVNHEYVARLNTHCSSNNAQN